MVFFVCGSCGASLKKNQVEKHCAFRCRYVEYVSCMDCNKEFWGQEYANHFKCITEDQKYGGSNYVQKENKGEKKQEAWIANVQEHVRVTPNMDPQLQEILNRIIVFTNIPRKKTKFENFLANCMRIRDPQILEKAWKTAPEKGLKINKLKKMVFGEYYAVHGADGHVKSETELCSLLNKKLSNRTDKYVVVKDRVKLRSATE
ncbi:putative cell growth-regulating nucleolar protein [Penaeus vannamei]|uniref:Putative cell growth-regulating nucleolar protein n=1 Tax=Penaeus vannamei TaxID=6689 RepID=A0A3R7PF06_PENVA|nr:putative cell growth-regulating nucleolar protein [Penaeus vannamei]